VADPAAPPASRARSAVIVAFAAVIVAFLGLTILMEWYQHVVYPTQLGRGQVIQMTANPNLTAEDRARVERMKQQELSTPEGRKKAAQQKLYEEGLRLRMACNVNTDPVQKRKFCDAADENMKQFDALDADN
jgi:hypothetical protein